MTPIQTIEQQAARIEVLEDKSSLWAALVAAEKRIKELETMVGILKDVANSDAILIEKAESSLAALQAKIENAKVVAWGDYLGQVRTQKELDMMYAIGDRRTCAYDRPLIRKEDLL